MPRSEEPAWAADVSQYVAAAMERYRVPGSAVAVIEDGAVSYERTFGVRGVADGRPITRETQFMMGSVNKSMTSMMMATLVDDGVLDWNTRVTDLLPSFALSDAASTPQIRVRDLVNHSSGVPQFDTPFTVERLKPRRLIESIREIPTLAAPGQVYGYSNQMYATGGFVAAIAAGAAYDDQQLMDTYAELMQRRVFGPLGMTHTSFDFDAAIATTNHALPNGYDPATDAATAIPLDFERAMSSCAPAGAVWSNLEDMEKYALSQLYGWSPNGERIVSEANLAVTHAPGIRMPDGNSYGMGWVVNDDLGSGGTALYHDGGTAGFTTFVFLVPAQRFAVVVLANATEARGFYNAVLQYVSEAVNGSAHEPDPTFATEQASRQELRELLAETVVPTRAAVEPLLGRYEHGIELRFSEKGFGLRTEFGTYDLAMLPEQGVFLGTGVFTGGVAVVPGDETPPSLTLGIPRDGGLGEAIVVHAVR